MRRYYRPLIVVFSSLALASLFSYAAVKLTERPPKQVDKGVGICGGVQHLSIYHPARSDKKGAANENRIPDSRGTSFCGEATMVVRSLPNAEELKNIEAFNKACNESFGGDPRKLAALANFYLMGIGTEKNEAEATRIYGIGAEKGDPECMAKFKAAKERAATASR
jgi:TPR repeat protein